jgi:cell division septation protein DedD
MPRNTDGEFEVLLGNKQLLSILFIVVIMLAAFFSMGYVLGRRAGPRGAAAKLPSEAAVPAVRDQSSGFSEAPSPGAASSARNAGEEPPAGSEPARTGTQPQQQMPVAEPPKPPVAPPAKAEVPSGPVEGQTYLQAAAAKRPDAELLAGVLKKKGFPVVLAPGPSESVLRVLVGPFADSEALAKARAGLEAAGFDKTFTRKY